MHKALHSLNLYVYCSPNKVYSIITEISTFNEDINTHFGLVINEIIDIKPPTQHNCHYCVSPWPEHNGDRTLPFTHLHQNQNPPSILQLAEIQISTETLTLSVMQVAYICLELLGFVVRLKTSLELQAHLLSELLSLVFLGFLGGQDKRDKR